MYPFGTLIEKGNGSMIPLGWRIGRGLGTVGLGDLGLWARRTGGLRGMDAGPAGLGNVFCGLAGQPQWSRDFGRRLRWAFVDGTPDPKKCDRR